MKQLEQSTFNSPIGDIDLLFHQGTLVYLDFADNPERMRRLLKARFGDFAIKSMETVPPMHGMLKRYFDGEAERFEDLQCDAGGTPFQRTVWQQLRRIPRGKTIDYSLLAKRAGNTRAVRAAASSNARNPLSIVIPCHRVIGKDGSLRGYAGGEYRKKWLLELEGAIQGTRR